MLSQAQYDAFNRDGFLTVPDFKTGAACDALITRAQEIVAAFDEQAHRSIFSTYDQSRTSDDYFLESASAIHCFFEEEAFAPDGSLHQAKALSINKIGHALHDLDPVFADFSRDPRLEEIVMSLGFAQPLLLQSMYIFKQPFIGGEVTCHQDATFLYTDPITVTGFWFALQDATVENGCLWALPGGHRSGLRRRFCRKQEGGLGFETWDQTDFPTEGLMPIEAKAGTLVILHGLLPHLSHANRSSIPRHAYTLHLIDGTAHYPADNWLQRRPDLPLRGF